MITVNILIFVVLSLVAYCSGILVISSKNPIHSVFFLIINFISVAGIFLLYGVEYVSLVLIIIYVGAIAILFLFVVMLLDIKLTEYIKENSVYVVIYSLILFTFISIIYIYLSADKLSEIFTVNDSISLLNYLVNNPDPTDFYQSTSYVERVLLFESLYRNNTLYNDFNKFLLLHALCDDYLNIMYLDNVDVANLVHISQKIHKNFIFLLHQDLYQVIFEITDAGYLIEQNYITKLLSQLMKLYYYDVLLLENLRNNFINISNVLLLENLRNNFINDNLQDLASFGEYKFYDGSDIFKLCDNELNFSGLKAYNDIFNEASIKFVDLLEIYWYVKHNFISYFMLDVDYFCDSNNFINDIHQYNEIANLFYLIHINSKELDTNFYILSFYLYQELNILELLKNSPYFEPEELKYMSTVLFNKLNVFYTNMDEYYTIKLQYHILLADYCKFYFDNGLTNFINDQFYKFMNSYSLVSLGLIPYIEGLESINIVAKALNYMFINYISDLMYFNSEAYYDTYRSMSDNYTYWIDIANRTSDIQNIGRVLYTNYFILFIVAGLILLVAMIGAIVLTLHSKTSIKRQNVLEQTSRHNTIKLFK